MAQKTILLWFRNDLRIHDNVIIHEAVKKNAFVIPVYCFNPFFFQKTKIGTLKTGEIRNDFIVESLLVLKSNLEKIGSDLIVVNGDPALELCKLALNFDVTDVYVHQEVASEENLEMDLVEQALWKFRIPLTSFIGHTLYHKQDLPFPIKDVPNTFSQFKKKVEKETAVRPEFPTPSHLESPDTLKSYKGVALESFKKLNSTSFFFGDKKFQGGEDQALLRLNKFLLQSDEKSKHEIKSGDANYTRHSTSLLSPYLSLGCISPRRIYHEFIKNQDIITSHALKADLILDLTWRDYFRFMFKKHGNTYFKVGGFLNKSFELSNDQIKNFKKWQSGNTNNVIVNEIMHELNTTGFINNKKRHLTASFLVDDLKVNWTWGAFHFEEKLIDYSPSTNWGNWANIAGVGNDIKEPRFTMKHKSTSPSEEQ